ncbi:josephin-2 isoform X1 [Orussus abietinus]|uniref:josephin-2 isoform X1 n=1 Tax=Orussus abietinus TaxID=222816 RepID=UPI000625C45B|nr:josephin-2 isoform X1 [Orussus abietinus]
MVTSTAFDMTGSIYHERQVKELCALHALNNLFQERGFSKQELDQICYSLSPHVWINPHKSLLGLGNYDINVIMAALQRKGREVVWFDKRRDPKCLCLDNIEGFILNVPTEYRLGFVLLPLKKRHWIALRKIHGTFYNLDSKLDVPQLIGTDNELLAYLKEQVDSKEKELFLVVSKEVDSQQGWLTETNGRNVDNNIERNSVSCIEDGYSLENDMKKVWYKKKVMTKLKLNLNKIPGN